MKKVLVIDDCKDFTEVVNELLSDAGYGVSVVDNAEDGIRRCEEESFDIVLCDLVLPSPDSGGIFDDSNDSAMVGVHTIHALSTKFPKLPIIAVSGQLTGSPLKSIERFGAVTCLSKPFGRDELLAAVDRAAKALEAAAE